METKKEFDRIVNEYIDDEIVKEQLKELFYDGIRSAIYEIDKRKNRELTKEDRTFLKSIFS